MVDKVIELDNAWRDGVPSYLTVSPGVTHKLTFVLVNL